MNRLLSVVERALTSKRGDTVCEWIVVLSALFVATHVAIALLSNRIPMVAR